MYVCVKYWWTVVLRACITTPVHPSATLFWACHSFIKKMLKLVTFLILNPVFLPLSNSFFHWSVHGLVSLPTYPICLSVHWACYGFLLGTSIQFTFDTEKVSHRSKANLFKDWRNVAFINLPPFREREGRFWLFNIELMINSESSFPFSLPPPF